MAQKYLVLYTGGNIAIPLEALARCGDLRFLDSAWDEKSARVTYTERGVLRDCDGKIIDESQILPAKKGDVDAPG